MQTGEINSLRFFEESLATYSRIAGPQDALTLSVQDDLCHLLLLIGQQEVRDTGPVGHNGQESRVYRDMRAVILSILQYVCQKTQRVHQNDIRFAVIKRAFGLPSY